MPNTRKRFEGLSYRLPAYLFPLALLLLEYAIRYLGHLATEDVGGPALASIGASMVASLTSFRKPLVNVTQDVLDKVTKAGGVVEARAAGTFRNICWIITIALTVVWAFAVVEAHVAAQPAFATVPLDRWLGVSSVLVGFIMSEVKEALA